MTDFGKFALSDHRVSSLTLDGYARVTMASINPTIIEERQLNAVAMDVFSRLMMDRIIFLGQPIDDTVANIVQAQLLYLASVDAKADISLYLNTPGGVVSAGLGIYDTMQPLRRRFPQSVPAWRLRWERCYSVPVKKANVPRCHIPA